MSGCASKQQRGVAITGGSTSGVVLVVCTVETATSSPPTSKSKPAGTDLYVQSASNSKAAQTEQRSAYTFVANQGKKGFVLLSLGQEEVKREERPAGFLSCTWCLLTARGLGKSFSLISRELPPDCEQDFTFT